MPVEYLTPASPDSQERMLLIDSGAKAPGDPPG
jgi:hypothetical protein